ncbi:MAG: hypothetical protein AAF204_00550 [Pseudomonadota bacterium]
MAGEYTPENQTDLSARDFAIQSAIPAYLFDAVEVAFSGANSPLTNMTREDQIAALNNINDEIQKMVGEGLSEREAAESVLPGTYDDNGSFVLSIKPEDSAIFLAQFGPVSELYHQQQAIKDNVVADIAANMNMELSADEQAFAENVFDQSAMTMSCSAHYAGMEGLDSERAQEIIMNAEAHAANENGEQYRENAAKIDELESDESLYADTDAQTEQDLDTLEPAAPEQLTTAEYARMASHVTLDDIQAHYGPGLLDAEITEIVRGMQATADAEGLEIDFDSKLEGIVNDQQMTFAPQPQPQHMQPDPNAPSPELPGTGMNG